MTHGSSLSLAMMPLPGCLAWPSTHAQTLTFTRLAGAEEAAGGMTEREVRRISSRLLGLPWTMMTISTSRMHRTGAAGSADGTGRTLLYDW